VIRILRIRIRRGFGSPLANGIAAQRHLGPAEWTCDLPENYLKVAADKLRAGVRDFVKILNHQRERSTPAVNVS
jgi:hypothetical protein